MVPPFLQDVPIPLFDKVKAEHVVPGMKALLEQLHQEITDLEASVQPTWAGLIEPLERIQDRHHRCEAWNKIDDIL